MSVISLAEESSQFCKATIGTEPLFQALSSFFSIGQSEETSGFQGRRCGASCLEERM